MSCEICERDFTSSRKPLCPLCAGSELYSLRFSVAEAALEKGSLEENSMKNLANLTRDQLKSQAARSSLRTHQLQTEKRLLKEELAERSELCKAAQADLRLRRSRLERMTRSLKERSQSLHKANPKDNQIEVLHNAMREKKIHLCRAFVDLSGLSPTVGDEQSALNLVNLKSMGSVPLKALLAGAYTLFETNTLALEANFEEYNAAIWRISNLLIQVATILGVRLPAEVLLPRKGDPSLGIRAPSLSYITPGSSSSRSASKTSRLSLFLEKDLTSLIQDDIIHYNRFIDALSLLVYNVTFLCHSQGFCVAKTAINNAFDLRCLVSLFLPEKQDSGQQPNAHEFEPNALGKYSHATAHNFLGGIEATKFLLLSRLPEYEVVRNELRNLFYDEEASLSWELIESNVVE